MALPAGGFLLPFLSSISDSGKRDKPDGWCHKMPRAQLLVKSMCKGNVSLDNCCNFTSSLSLSPKLRACVEHEQGKND